MNQQRPNNTEHDSHGDATLSLVVPTDDGGRIFQSWTICACNVPGLRQRLGTPAQESYSDAAAVRAIGRAVLNTPGNIQMGG